MGQRKTVLALFAILAIGAFLRLYHITSIPPGLYPDEAMNGSNGLAAMHTGHFSVFYPDNNGREGLFINIQAVSVALFGREAWALRVVSALFGTLTILGVYLVACELFVYDSIAAPAIAMFSAFFTATSYWHLNFSRIGFRAITGPFFLSFGLYFLLRGFRRNSIWDMVWAGAFTGLGFDGYIAFRFAPFVFAVPILWKLWEWKRERNQPQSHAERSEASHEILRSAQDDALIQKSPTRSCTPCVIALFLFVTFVAALPIGWYFLKHPADFTGRSSEISVFSATSPLYEFTKSNALTLGMFFVRGDCNGRHNYICKPELNPIVAIFFAIGLIFSVRSLIKNPNDPKKEVKNARLGIWTLLAWLAFMSLPATLTREGIPHALRSMAMIPAVMILSGLGAYAVFSFRLHDAKKKKIIYLVAVLLAVIITAQTYRDYFIAWATRPQTAAAFTADLWHIGQYLNTIPPQARKYVIPDFKGNSGNGVPVVAEPIAFATDTFRPEEQQRKNTSYISSREDFMKITLIRNELIIIAPLNKNDPDVIGTIRERFPQLREIDFGDFLIFSNF